MKTYTLRIVGNDGFDRMTDIKAESIEEALKSVPAAVEWHSRTTIEQFVRIELFDANE